MITIYMLRQYEEIIWVGSTTDFKNRLEYHNKMLGSVRGHILETTTPELRYTREAVWMKAIASAPHSNLLNKNSPKDNSVPRRSLKRCHWASK